MRSAELFHTRAVGFFVSRRTSTNHAARCSTQLVLPTPGPPTRSTEGRGERERQLPSQELAMGESSMDYGIGRYAGLLRTLHLSMSGMTRGAPLARPDDEDVLVLTASHPGVEQTKARH